MDLVGIWVSGGGSYGGWRSVSEKEGEHVTDCLCRAVILSIMTGLRAKNTKVAATDDIKFLTACPKAGS